MKNKFCGFKWNDHSEEEQRIHLQKLILSKVKEDENGCWIWQKYKNKWGYGTIDIGPVIDSKKVNAHKASWIAFKGDVPQGIFVCHICDIRTCCNPNHLFLGTPRQNQQDRIKKGKDFNGEKNPASSLTNKDVLEMLEMFKKGYSEREMARIYNISKSSAYNIKRGITWGHVGDRAAIKIKKRKTWLTEEIVREIKNKFKNGSRICDVVKEYGYSRGTVDDIKKNRTWKHVVI